ncbi:MAG: chromate transporter-domain-containing protein [Linnemannia elongata]|nr:MAG: chromate transporter-domain-containing protein [Linnemannia elongata]
MTTVHSSSHLPPLKDRLKEIFSTYFKLGYTTFGGPAAHIGILYGEIVEKRKWISSEQFTELFAICQALPGPASTELAYSLALVRSGFLASVFAFILWSVPGAIVMTVAGILIGDVNETIPIWATRLEQGLAAAAVGLVALAAYKMSTTLATDKLTRILALISGGASALYTAPWLLPVLMIAGGLTSWTFDAYLFPLSNGWKEKRAHRKAQEELSGEKDDLEQGHVANQEAEATESATAEGHSAADAPVTVIQSPATDDEKTPSVHGSIRSRNKAEDATLEVAKGDSAKEVEPESQYRPLFTYSKKLGLFFFLVFLTLLVASILVRALVPESATASYGPLTATFYFTGSIIFGGGPVIIPLLRTYTVDSGWMNDKQFLVGLALIQSLPGPNFNFACFLGAVSMVRANQSGVVGAFLGYLAIFFPGLILKNAIIPFWQSVREHKSVKMVFRGVNACALGLVFSATWLLFEQTNRFGGSSGYHSIIASAAFVANGYLDFPAPLVIILGGAMGAIEYAVTDL